MKNENSSAKQVPIDKRELKLKFDFSKLLKKTII